MKEIKKKIQDLEDQYNSEQDYKKRIALRGYIDNIQGKLRREVTKVKELEKKEKFLNFIKNPPIKNPLVKWEPQDSAFKLVYGFYKNKKLFEIKQGISTFELKIMDKTPIDERFVKPHYSMHIIELQKKANKILSESLTVKKNLSVIF